MADNERDIVLRISVDADDIGPEVARLKAELAALDKAATDGANKSSAAQDKASEATRKRKGATEDLGKSVTAQGAAERKSLEERLKILQEHQKALAEYGKQLDEYKRKLSEVEAANRVAQSRFRQGAVRKLELQELPPEPAKPAIQSNLLRNTFEASTVPTARVPRPKRPVDQQAVNLEAKQIVDEEQKAAEALAKAVNDERKRRPPAALPAPDPVSVDSILRPVSSNDVMDQVRQSVTGAQSQQPKAPQQSVEQRIREAYARLAKGPGEDVGIGTLRRELAGIPRPTFNNEMRKLLKADDVRAREDRYLSGTNPGAGVDVPRPGNLPANMQFLAIGVKQQEQVKAQVQEQAKKYSALEQRIRDAYTVAKDGAGYAKFADLRDQLPDLSKDTLRTELLRMAREDQSVNLASAPPRLPKRESEAAFRFRNERVDRLSILSPERVAANKAYADAQRGTIEDRQAVRATKRAQEEADRAEFIAAQQRKKAADKEATASVARQRQSERYTQYLADIAEDRRAAEPQEGLNAEQILAKQLDYVQKLRDKMRPEVDDDGDPIPNEYDEEFKLAQTLVPRPMAGEKPFPEFSKGFKAPKTTPAPQPQVVTPATTKPSITMDFFEKTDPDNKFKQSFQAFVKGMDESGNSALYGSVDKVNGRRRFDLENDPDTGFPGATASSLQALINKVATFFDVQGRAAVSDDDGVLTGSYDIKAARRAAVTAAPTPEPEPVKAPEVDREAISQQIQDFIRNFYEEFASAVEGDNTQPGMSLRRIRGPLDEAGFARADQDEALRRLSRQGMAVYPESNQKMLTEVDRAASVNIGNQDMNLISSYNANRRSVGAVAGSPYGDTNALDRDQLIAQLRAAEAAEDAAAARSAAKAPPPPPPPVEPPTPSVPDEPEEDPAARKARLAAGRRERAAARRREKREEARLEAEEAARAARGPLELDAPEERLAIGPAQQQPIPIERNRTGLDPFVMQNRERQRRDRYNVKRKERREQERVVRDLVRGFLSQIEGIDLDGPAAIEGGDAPLQITGRPRSPIAVPRNRSGQGPFARGGGNAREADEALDQLYNEFVNGPGRQYRRPELPGPVPRLAITDGSEQNTTRRRRTQRDKVRIDVDCDYLHASIDKCLGRRGFKHTLRVDIDPNSGVGSASAPGAAQAGPADPVTQAKLDRAGKAAEDKEAARVRKETAQEERATAKEDREARKAVNDYAKDTARINRDTANDASQFTVDAKASAAEAAGERARAAQARADAAETARETARIRQEALKLANQDAVEQRAARTAAARANAESARLRTEETRRRNERRQRLDEEMDNRPRARPRPPGLFRGIAQSFGMLGNDARRATGRFLDTTGQDPDEDTEGAERVVTRRVLQYSGNRVAGLFRPRRPAASRFTVGGEGIVNELKDVEKKAESVFAGIRRGFKGAFGDKDGNNSGRRFFGGVADSVSNLASNIASSFSGMGKTLFSFRGVIIAAVAALGPLVAILGSLSAGALAAGNALFQLAAASAALPGLLLAATSAVGALVVAFKPLSGILSAYSAVQDATAKGTAATTKQQRDAIRSQQDLNRARRDAKRELEDLNTALSRAKLTENGAILSVKSARQRYLETLADPGASVLDQQQAFQAYEESKNSLTDTRTKIRRDREDASPEGQRRFGNDAQRKIEDAEETNAADGNAAAKTAKEKLEAQLKDASKSTKEFALGLAAIFLDDNSPWKQVQKATSEALFAPLVPELGNIRKLLGPIGALLETAAGALGGVFANAIEVFSKPPFTAIFADLAESNVKIIGSLGGAATSVAEAFLYIAEAARPFTEWIGGAIKGLADDFRDWAKSGMESGSIGEYLTKVVKPTLQQIGQIVGNVFGALKNLFLGSNDFTKDFFGSLVMVTQQFEDWSESAADPNSGFRKFLRDTMPLLKQLGTFLVDAVKAFFQLASDPKNIKEAQKILTALSERVLPALVRFFSDLAESGLVSKLANAFGAAAEAIAALLENGGSTAISVFITGVEKLVEVLSWFVSNPVVASIITGLGIALATLAGASLFFKFTGLSTLVKLLGYLILNKDNLSRVFGDIRKFFTGGGFTIPGTGKPPAKPGTDLDVTKPAGSAGEAAAESKENARFAGIRTQLTTIITLLERIAACTCADDIDGPGRTTRQVPGNSGNPASAASAAGPLNGAATRLTTAATELIFAARSLAAAGAISSGPYRIPASVGNPIVGAPRAITRALPYALATGAVPAAIAANPFRIPASVGDPIPDGPGGTRVTPGINGPRVNPSVIDGEFTEDTRKPGFFSRLFGNRGTRITSARNPSFVTRAASAGGRFATGGGLALPGAALGIFADTYFQGEDRKSTAAQLARAGGAVLTGAGIGGQFAGPYGAIAGAIAGGAYSLYQDPGLRKKTNNYLQSPLGMFTSPGASLISRALTTDKKGDSGIERAWDGAYEGFMRAVGSPIAAFFTTTLPGFFSGIGDFFTKTLPDVAGRIPELFSRAFDTIGDFFTKTLPSLPSRAFTAFNRLVGRMIRIFAVELPQAALKFFTKTIPHAVEDALRAAKATFFDPAVTFFGETLPNQIHDLFTKKIPAFFLTAVTAFHNNIGLPIKNFILGIPDFFTKTIPQWFSSLPGIFTAYIVTPITTFFSTTLPRFFTETLPNAISRLPGIINANIIQPVISFFSAIPGTIADFFSGNFDALVDLAKRIFGRSTREVRGGYDDQAAGRQSGGLIEGTYDGRVDTKLVPLTIGEFVARKRVVDKPMGRNLFEDLNQERVDPADFYAALNFSARQSKNLSVNVPVMTLGSESSTSTQITNSVTNNRGGTSFGDVHIHNPIREKSDQSMRRTLHKLAYMTGR